MTTKTREELKADYRKAAAATAVIEAERAALLEPTKERWLAACEVEMDAEEALDIHIIGKCEGCSDIICDDEPSYYDGEYYSCKVCAPKAGGQLKELLAAGDEAHNWFDEGKPAYEACVAYLKTLPADQSLASV